MTLETELYKNLREERLGNLSVAARKTHALLEKEGYEPLPYWGSVMKMIRRAEQEGAPKRSAVWPYYQRLLGLEEQRPTIEAAMAALSEVDERLEELNEILAGLVDRVEEQTRAIKEGSRSDHVAINEAVAEQLRKILASTGPAEMFLKRGTQIA